MESLEKELMTEYLNAVYQNIRTAIQSIEDILPSVKDEELKKELASEEDKYLILEKSANFWPKPKKLMA